MPTDDIVVESDRLTMDAMLPEGPAVMIRFLTFGAAFAGDAALNRHAINRKRHSALRK